MAGPEAGSPARLKEIFLMKSPPLVPGTTDAERMSNALNMVLKVSKADLLKKEALMKRASEKKRAKKPS